MPTIQMFYAICSPGITMTRHVHGIIVSVCTKLENPFKIKFMRANWSCWACFKVPVTRRLMSISFCCSTVCCLVKAPFSSRTFSKTRLHCFFHYIQSRNNHKIGLCTQKQGRFPQVHGSGGHHPCWCHYWLSHHLIWPFPEHQVTWH